MTSQNFDHLLDIDRPLTILASHAERYFVYDANTALIKTRQFAERTDQGEEGRLSRFTARTSLREVITSLSLGCATARRRPRTA